MSRGAPKIEAENTYVAMPRGIAAHVTFSC